ncbi:MAG: helix-turn-helix domain-containing protein [Polyangiaceae bacterium]
MQAPSSAIQGFGEMHPYNPGMARPSSKPRPKQAARLAALRKAAGLSQNQLAKAIDVSQQTIAYWETTSVPPRSDVLPSMAKALGVRVEDILSDTPINAVRLPGPVGEVQRAFEEVRKLPRKQQRKVIEMVQALVEQYKRKTS